MSSRAKVVFTGMAWLGALGVASPGAGTARAEGGPGTLAPLPPSAVTPPPASSVTPAPAGTSAGPAASPAHPAPPPPSVASGSAGHPLEIPAPKAPDAGPAPTDHALVVGLWGVEARRISAAVGAFALRPSSGCPAVAATGQDPSHTPCEVPLNALVLRHWVRPGFAWSAGLAFALGGGRQGDANLDTYAGVGPVLGVTLLLGQWQHLAIGASPEVTWVVFKPASSASTVNHVEVSGGLEAELHFGFIALPALSVALRAGLHLELDRSGSASVWGLGFAGPTSAWGLLNDVAVRYYF